MNANKWKRKILRKILIILGTRPEAIKLAPVILRLRKSSEYEVLVCNTEQQKELSSQTLGFFGITPDFNLDVMRTNQTLAGVQSRILTSLSELFQKSHYDATIVQGDTMSVFCGALVSFYNRCPVFHVEAGLRSYDLSEPFPEEALRQMTTRIASMHFAPTRMAYDALVKEGVQQTKIHLTGNTVIDALHSLSPDTIATAMESLQALGIRLGEKLVLVTVHRRENHGERLESILSAITELTKSFPDHQFVLPVHPNPNVQSTVYTHLGKVPNAILTEPMDYPLLVCLIKTAKLILTDSGGIQEEAPTFGVPVLVLRYETERTEGVAAGFSKLVGADKTSIKSEATKILESTKEKTRLDGRINPYGDGHAAVKIAEAISKFHWQ